MTFLLLNIPVLFGISLEVYIIVILLGVGFYFFWRWVYKNLMPNNDRKRIFATITSAILSAPMFYVLIILLWTLFSSYYPSRDFNNQRWFNDFDKRYELSESIVESKLLLGKTKKEVQDVLGKPDGRVEENFWGYELGYKPGIIGNIDPTFLYITFDNGIVVKVEEHES